MTTDAPRRLLRLEHVGAHDLDRLVEVVNALADLVAALADRIDLIEDYLDLDPAAEPPWENITVRDELL